MSGKLRVTVDPAKCTASTTCLYAAPEIFELPDGADTAVVRIALLDDPALMELAREAEASCPTAAIELAEAD